MDIRLVDWMEYEVITSTKQQIIKVISAYRIILQLLPCDQRPLARLDSRKPSILNISNQEM